VLLVRYSSAATHHRSAWQRCHFACKVAKWQTGKVAMGVSEKKWQTGKVAMGVSEKALPKFGKVAMLILKHFATLPLHDFFENLY